MYRMQYIISLTILVATLKLINAEELKLTRNRADISSNSFGLLCLFYQYTLNGKKTREEGRKGKSAFVAFYFSVFLTSVSCRQNFRLNKYAA